MIRLDNTVSHDYLCIFVQAHSEGHWSVPWLSKPVYPDYLKLRYTPRSGKQDYGIMFIDPKTLDYEAHVGWAFRPTQYGKDKVSAQILLKWIEAQPNSTKLASHAQDAQDVYDVLMQLADQPISKFGSSDQLQPKNFRIGHEHIGDGGAPSWTDLVFMFPAIFASLVYFLVPSTVVGAKSDQKTEE